jgi:hypothetical protein
LVICPIVTGQSRGENGAACVLAVHEHTSYKPTVDVNVTPFEHNVTRECEDPSKLRGALIEGFALFGTVDTVDSHS